MIRIGNASGFYGDRFSAVEEMLTGGPLDVLTGDYLAELTMLILGRDRLKDPKRGYAKTFLRQLETGLGLALDNGVRIVSNAGGLNPSALAEAIHELADQLGLAPKIAYVEGDDILHRLPELDLQRDPRHVSQPDPRPVSQPDPRPVSQPDPRRVVRRSSVPLRSGTDDRVATRRETGTDDRRATRSESATEGTRRETGAEGTRGGVLTANVYLGAWGIAEALREGADVVVTGRVTDASLTVGPAAAFHGWNRDDYDKLAGATVAGHIIECGCQATGGNFSFFTEIPDLNHPGFPIAEIDADGNSMITKHDGTGGAVTVDTVAAQLLYEIGGARYAGPDVTTRLDTVVLEDAGPDRVRVSGVRGEPPPATYKVSLNSLGGFRNEVTFVLTGLDIDAKAELTKAQLGIALARKPPRETRWTLARLDQPDAGTEEQASALLRCTVRDPDAETIGRVFSNAAVELALAGYPGFHLTAPPGDAAPYGVFTAGYVDAKEVPHTVVLPDGTRRAIEPAGQTADLETPNDPPLPEPMPDGPTRRGPLGTIAGARSGDKGGDANIGVWVRTGPAWRWLAHYLTVDRIRELLPETTGLTVTRHLFPNLRAVNFVVEGLLGEGVASQSRFDPQAKAVGEWLRSRYVDIPEALL